MTSERSAAPEQPEAAATYDVMADAICEIADEARTAFVKFHGFDPGEWDGDDIVHDVKRGLWSAIERCAQPKALLSEGTSAASKDDLLRAAECATELASLPGYAKDWYIALASRLRAAAEGCAWTPDDDGIYHTTCGNAFTFIDAGPQENKMGYCCYCGKGLLSAAQGESRG